MSALIKALLFQLCLMQMQCIRGASSESQPMQQLLQLNDIVTNRINSTLNQYAYFRNQSKNVEFLRQYERLEMAAALSVDQLDEKIRAYNEYIAYDKERLQLENNLGNVQQLRTDQPAKGDQLVNLFSNRTAENQTRADAYSAFEKRVLKLLRKLGVHDPFTERVFKAILSDEEQLKKLKKKLNELGDDDDDNKDNDCSLWDFVFTLF